MRKARKKTSLFLAVIALAVPVLPVSLPAAAAADPVASTGWASSGSVDAMIDNEHIITGELARCSADGPLTARTAGGATGAVAVFGNGDTVCGRTGPTSIAQASGHRFETAVLKRFGGPVLTVRTYWVKCSTTDDGALGDVEIGTVTGMTVPANIPANYKVVIPGGAAGTALATVILNETVTPDPADGSLVTHALHIKLFPQGGPASGDIYLGTAACDPFGKDQPAELSQGK